MKRLLSLGWLAAMSALPFPEIARAQHAEYDGLVATHAKANGVPESLVHRIIVRESRYRADLVGRGGTIGLMQIKLATARGLGYTGDAAGLRDPDTNLSYGVKYLAGAYRAGEIFDAITEIGIGIAQSRSVAGIAEAAGGRELDLHQPDRAAAPHEIRAVAAFADDDPMHQTFRH